MRTSCRRTVSLAVILWLCASVLAAQQAAVPQPADARAVYRLGPLDVLLIRTPDLEENVSERTVRIGSDGCINLPLVGRFQAAGLTTEQLEAGLTEKFKEFYKEPQVGVSVIEFRSQTVSVLGMVRNPGVLQLPGDRTLVEVISLAGGLADAADPTIRISRQKEQGMIPLPNAKADASGQVSIGEVNFRDILTARSTELNILIRPGDIISVAQAPVIYVVGDVARPTTVPLNNQESISVMQIMAVVGGPLKSAALSKTVILRPKPGAQKPDEIALDLKKIMNRKAEDVMLRPNDILFVPGSASKQAWQRAVDVAISIGSGMLTYGLIRR